LGGVGDAVPPLTRIDGAHGEFAHLVSAIPLGMTPVRGDYRAPEPVGAPRGVVVKTMLLAARRLPLDFPCINPTHDRPSNPPGAAACVSSASVG
jgi:hypothetical protein